MRYTLFLLLLSLQFAWGQNAELRSPEEFLHTDYRANFTPHHLMIDYFNYVGENSDRVIIEPYGYTNEGRPLQIALVSSPENLESLESIRLAHLQQAGLMDGDGETEKVIIWLSFGVHGNEAAAAESALSVLYELTGGDNPNVNSWLENTVIVIDQNLNPDGNSRYTNWYRGVAVSWPDPREETREHDEPWPGGRVNHYYYDLNRDWAWATQVESKQRLAIYQRWMPQIHVDFHEQYPDDPYYFAPAAAPFHSHITDWQSQLQTDIGINHTKYFDEAGWLYFTREIFDLLYPSYGDTYPTFNGAIGMTYEQAGHSPAGRAIEQEHGDTLTLADRIAHHTATALSTIETASTKADEMNREFNRYFKNSAVAPPGPYKTFVVPATNPQGKVKAFTELLDLHGIQYGKAGKLGRVAAFDYNTRQVQTIEVQAEDLIISAYQPKAILTQVLLEPETALEDSLTYDITAWSLPYAYGLQAYASDQRLEPKEAYTFAKPTLPTVVEEPYACVFGWESLDDARMIGKLLQAGLKLRYASKPFAIDDESFSRGSVIITKGDNRKVANWYSKVRTLAAEEEIGFAIVQTGFSSNGPDLGSASMQYMESPKVMLFYGDGVDPNAFGQAWHYFERVLEYPVAIAKQSKVSSIPWEDYNVLVLPEGRYQWSESQREALQEWARGGGRIIAMGSAVGGFGDWAGAGIQRKSSGGESGGASTQEELPSYEEAERAFISDFIPGAIFKVSVDATHPLGYGLGEHYFSLKTNSTAYSFLESGWNVGTLGDELTVVGFAGYRAKNNQKQSLSFGIARQGRGSIIYLVDNPLFRGFWQEGQRLFANALFFAGQ